MFARIIILLLMTQLSLILNVALAEVNYVSLHDIESAERQPLFLKINLVEKGQTLPLKFTLLSQHTETDMAAHRINKFMVRLASLRSAIGESHIVVYEFNDQSWNKVQEVDISNDLKVINSTNKTQVSKNLQTKAVTKKLNTVANSTQGCLLKRKPKETLWSIASRYKSTWHVNIFSAMLAIYQSNKQQFTRQHIGYLIDNAPLTCPMTNTLAIMGDKAAMKAEFSRLNKLPLAL